MHSAGGKISITKIQISDILKFTHEIIMEVDPETINGDYKRKQDDLKQMIRHAKLNPKNITTICQVFRFSFIFFPINKFNLLLVLVLPEN